MSVLLCFWSFEYYPYLFDVWKGVGTHYMPHLHRGRCVKRDIARHGVGKLVAYTHTLAIPVAEIIGKTYVQCIVHHGISRGISDVKPDI